MQIKNQSEIRIILFLYMNVFDYESKHIFIAYLSLRTTRYIFHFNFSTMSLILLYPTIRLNFEL
jgi:hypothetical protein